MLLLQNVLIFTQLSLDVEEAANCVSTPLTGRRHIVVLANAFQCGYLNFRPIGIAVSDARKRVKDQWRLA